MGMVEDCYREALRAKAQPMKLTLAILAALLLVSLGLARAEDAKPPEPPKLSDGSPAQVATVPSNPIFPTHITVDGATLVLNADGTCRGDAAAFRRKLAAARSATTPDLSLIAWLAVRATLQGCKP